MGLLGQSTTAWCVFAYLVAAIPVGLVIGRLRGVDLRAIGSGNIGATNAVRALGRKWGAAVFLLDVLKAFGPVALAARADALGGVSEPESAIAWVGAAATLGHIYPIYLRFRGGKGVACALGVFFAILPLSGLLAVILYAQTLILTRVSALGSLTAVNAATLHILVSDAPAPYKLLALGLSALIFWRHRSNIREAMARARAHRRDTTP
ncbi:MAG: glycerol-3-phosphate acyltransferase [Nannocystaceae bacterium]